jgi:hypothetical protein
VSASSGGALGLVDGTEQFPQSLVEAAGGLIIADGEEGEGLDEGLQDRQQEALADGDLDGASLVQRAPAALVGL